jgi:hypothetical protein
MMGLPRNALVDDERNCQYLTNWAHTNVIQRPTIEFCKATPIVSVLSFPVHVCALIDTPRINLVGFLGVSTSSHQWKCEKKAEAEARSEAGGDRT